MKRADIQQTDEHVFADAVDELANRLGQGEPVDVDLYVRRFPRLAERLRNAVDALKTVYALRPECAIHESDSEEEPQLKSLGDFRIIGELGRGGMGIVYEAEQNSLGRRVALKVLPFAALLDERQLRRFRTEARAAAMLKHPNIVSVYSVGTERSVHFYAMELIDGLSLAEIIADRRRTEAALVPTRPDDSTTPVAKLSTEFSTNRQGIYRRIAELGIQVADALQFAHEEGVLHRDIKPGNLLLDREGKVHVADFGLARTQTQDDLTMTGDLIGTLRYMSPEQLQGQCVDARSDVYSLGLTLYELIASCPAFDAKNRLELSRRIVEAEPAALRKTTPTVPRDLENIVHKAIARTPDGRYSSARELSEYLRRFVDDKPARARPVGSAELAWRWCLRNRAKAAMLAFSFVVLLGLAIGGPFVAHQQSALAEERRWELYAAHIKEAHQAMLRGEQTRANELLEPYIPNGEGVPDLRGFEWKWLRSQTHHQIHAPTIPSQGLSVHSIARSPDGTRIAVGDYFGMLKCIDSLTCQEIWSIPWSKTSKIWRSIQYSADGRFLIAGSQGRHLIVLNSEAGSELLRLSLSRAISAATLSMHGELVVGFGDDLQSELVPIADSTPLSSFQR